MRRWSAAIASSVALAALCAHATPPARVVIEYEVLHNGGPLATVRHVLEHDAASYRLSETWEGSGLLSLLGKVQRSSHGRVTPTGLRPLVYEDRRPRRDLATARFEWEEGKLIQKFHGAPRSEPLPLHAQDRLSVLFAPAFAPPGKEAVEFHVADGKGVSHYVFEVAGRERVTVPAGEFDAVRLVRREMNGRQTEIWLDSARSLLPLRILVIDTDGTRTDQVAARIEPPA